MISKTNRILMKLRFNNLLCFAFMFLAAPTMSFALTNSRVYTIVDNTGSNPVYVQVFELNSDAKFTKAASLTVSKSVNNTAGGFLSALTTSEFKTVTDLTVTGTIDARDFRVIRDSMTVLTMLDLSGANIIEYNGTEGTSGTGSTLYPANEIPQYALYNSSYTTVKAFLTTVKMPLSTTSIGIYAFQNCRYLTTIDILPTIVSIGKSAFYNCTNLSSVFIPASVSYIGESAFMGYNLSYKVDSANTAFSSSDGILFDKSQTTLIRYPNNKYGAYSIPSTVKTLSNLAFFACNNLSDITLPLSLTSLGNQAFSYCKGISTIFIPSSVTTMGSYTFLSSSCQFSVDENNPNFSGIDGLLFNKNKTVLMQCPTSKIGSYIIPSSVTSISYMGFQDCISLTAITVPPTVTNLVYSVFKNCSGLTSFTIPSTVNSIGSYAFYNCSNLTSIYAFPTTATNLSTSSSVFYNINKSNCTLYVPKNSKALYQTAAQWADFNNIIEMTTAIPTLLNSKINIYPNPIHESFSIHGLTESVNIKLTDINGKQVVNCQVGVGETVKVGELAKGMYIVRITTIEGTMERKMIKE